jgi:hypothetical protein
MKIQFYEGNIRIRISISDAELLSKNSKLHLEFQQLVLSMNLGNYSAFEMKNSELSIILEREPFLIFLKSETESFEFQQSNVIIRVEKDLAYFKTGFSLTSCQ